MIRMVLPLLPVRGAVVFPSLVVPLMVNEQKQARLIDEALMQGSTVGLFVQTDQTNKDPGPNDIYEVGTSGNILKMLRFPDGSIRFLVQGLSRIRIKRFVSTAPYLTAEVEEVVERTRSSVKMEAVQRNFLERLKKVIELSPNLSEELYVSAINQETPSRLADLAASSLNISIQEKQEILEEADVYKRLERMLGLIIKETEVLEISKQIQSQAQSELGKVQRELILREQMKAIRKELGDKDDRAEIDEFQQRIAKAGMPELVEAAAHKELERLARMNPASAEYTVSRSYLEWLVILPWAISTRDVLVLSKAKKILNEDHYNLDRVKDRILEYLAVRKLKSDVKGPILCFVGPPGVGKTSLGRSIARAMGRRFERISLGGMRDEAEIRGHRRTYIGALPGRIIQSIKRAGSNNPIMMLDEVDKIGADFRGDPSSALLEVLDPEQNDTFSDHYLDVPFDLSRVMFITTANLLDPIPAVLRDRMEIIRIPGYTDLEKLEIAKRHLIPKQYENHGITKSNLLLKDSAVLEIIHGYTRESGLRNLEREIAAICRKVARRVASGLKTRYNVSGGNVHRYLGPVRFARETLSKKGQIGVVPGLAWTAFGGEILFIEATGMHGKRGLTLTGHLGEIMKESAMAALSFVRTNCDLIGIPPDYCDNHELHVHVPSGATPKDGPSAGITIATALASLLSGRPVKSHLAMTGELTLRGQVLPIGGLKEKLLAAYRASIKTVILPAENRKDLSEIPSEIKKAIRFIFVQNVDQVLKHALAGKPGGRKGPRRRGK
ncbi:MAG: endopeptidase La [Candidatus Zixiibacteriota bacterium]|nr:MAG: endopeptidase La [candidate division Zixibacteria bacterium]